MAPRWTVLTVARDVARERVEACMASVRAQTTSDWQHVIVGGPTTVDDERVVMLDGDDDPGTARDAGLAVATGELIAIVDADDTIEPDALARMETALGSADLAYSDHDHLTVEGHLVAPALKPDFSPEQLRWHDYVGDLVAVRRTAIDAVGGFRPGFGGADVYDLVLRVAEQTDRIAHVAEVLHHRRARGGVVGAPPPPDLVAGRTRAVSEHLRREGVDATVEPGLHPETLRIRRTTERERVSVVIPTRGSSRPVWGRTRCFVTEAVRSLVEQSTHPDLEFVVVYDTGTPDAVLRTLERLAGDRLVLVEFTETFNFSTKINVGATAATGPLLLILNDDTELLEPESVEVMAALLDDPTVGMVGPKLRFADGTIQDGGHVYHEHVLGGLVGWDGDGCGPSLLRPLAVTREVSGVTAAAAMIRRDVFDEVGGFDPQLWMNFNDVDLSLKVRATGRRILWTPDASWFHFESQTRPPTAEPEEFVELDRRWHTEINRDPYYPPMMVERRADWLELPWHSGHPPLDDVDVDEGTWTWVRERLLGISSSNPWAWLAKLRLPLLAAAVVLLALAADRALGGGSGWLERLATSWLPVTVLGGALGGAVRRERWALGAGVLVAATPAWLGAVTEGVVAGVGWAVAVAVGVLVGPLARRRPALAAAAAIAALAVVLVVWSYSARHVGLPAAPPQRAAVDAVAPPAGRWSAFAVLAVATWAAGLVVLGAWAWCAGRRQVALAAVGVAVVTEGLGLAFDAAVDGTGAIAGIGLLALAVVPATARIDHRSEGARAVFLVVAVTTGLGWCTATLAALDAGDATGGSVALAAAGMVALAASLAVLGTRRRDAPFADPALAEARQGRPGEGW